MKFENEKNILTYLIVFAFNLAFGQNNLADTIKITLYINNKLIKEPFKYIDISVSTSQQKQNIKFEKNYVLISSIIPDSSEVIVFFQKEEIGRCYKYAPKILRALSGLDIKIINSGKALKKEIRNSTDEEKTNYGTLKSMCVFTTVPKEGDGVSCVVKNWIILEPVEYKKLVRLAEIDKKLCATANH